MKKYQRVCAVLLCVLLLFGAALPAFAEETGTRLYNVYGDYMLFQQNADAVFAGVSAPGTALAVTLTDKTGTVVRTTEGAAEEDGTFSLSFPAPAGSYDPYTVTLYADGAPVRTLSDVVFGELWLSIGQSNMEYTLSSTPEGMEMANVWQTGSHNLRVLQISQPMQDGEFCSDKLPQTEPQECYWYPGESGYVYGMSACAFFFAQKLLSELDVPVGILNASVGGSSISTWLPREAIEGDAAARQGLASHGDYISLENWETRSGDFYTDMTGLYNSKIAPLTNFRLAGAIWYQGETDLGNGYAPALYMQLLELLQDTYTSAFSYKNGTLPMIFTQLASYRYREGPYYETAFNEAFTRLAAEKPESRGMVTVTDVSLDYYEYVGAIHPMTKKPIGERMGDCALGLLYGGGQPATAAAQTAARARGGSVYVTFSNVGDGLVCKGDALRGFAVYGADGVCLPAEAEIVSADTVRVWNSDVPVPVGATYAVNSLSPNANLWSSFGGAPYMPAAAFGASDPAVTKLFDDAEWLRCDTLSAWCNTSDAGVRDVWTAKDASLSVSADAAEGSGAVQITGEKASFTVLAPFAEGNGIPAMIIDNIDADFTRYGTLSLKVKNTGASDVTLAGLRFYRGGTLYFSPVLAGSAQTAVAIPADGAWHTLTFDLDQLRLNGIGLESWNNDALKDVTGLRLCFEGENASLLLDDFRFLPESSEGGNAGALLQRIVAFVRGLFEKIKALFSGGLFNR